MGHHYVPRRYLSGFAVNERLAIFKKDTGQVFRGQPATIANERELYGEKLENHLSKAIEAPSHEVFDKIAARAPLTSRDREILANYIVTAWKRVPAARARVMNQLPQTIERTIDRRSDEVRQFDDGDDEQLKGRATEVLSELARVRAKLLADPPVDIWRDIVVPERTPMMVEALLSMNWAFLTDSNGTVLSSDNPVYFFPWAGVGREESELVFPVNQNVAMLASREKFQSNRYFEARPAALREINRRTVHNADRQVYARTAFEWVPRLIAKNAGPQHRLWVRAPRPVAL